LVVSGSGAVAFFARLRGAGADAALPLGARLAGAVFAAPDLAGVVLVAAFAGLAPARVLAEADPAFVAFVARDVPDSRLGAADLAARFAGADPLADLAAEAFFAGVLVAVRFTG
jgi:hypothetical protein